MTVNRLSTYRSEDPFTRVPNTAVSDPRLDLKALGLLLLMLSKPDGWTFRERSLAKDAGVGRAQLRTAMQTLIDAGYVRRTHEVVDGRPVCVTAVFDTAEGSETEPSRGSGFPTVGKSDRPETEPVSNEVVPVTNENSVTNESSRQWPDEVRRTTRTIARMVRQNGHPVPAEGSPTVDRWLEEVDRLLRIGPPGADGPDQVPTADEVVRVATWALTVSDFWPANIRSPQALRRQWSRLRLQANGAKPSGVQLADGYAQAAERLRKAGR